MFSHARIRREQLTSLLETSSQIRLDPRVQPLLGFYYCENSTDTCTRTRPMSQRTREVATERRLQFSPGISRDGFVARTKTWAANKSNNHSRLFFLWSTSNRLYSVNSLVVSESIYAFCVVRLYSLLYEFSSLRCDTPHDVGVFDLIKNVVILEPNLILF